MASAADANTGLVAYLCPGRFIDSDHPAVSAYAREHTRGLRSPREIAVALYYAVRDGFRYDPYRIDKTPHGFTASTCIERGYGFCVTKAALLAATGRVMGMPTRVGFADVRNHLTSPRLQATMRTDVFVYHGYTEFHLDGRWVKATPAFNLSLCQKASVLPLEFDGHNDSIFHPLDADGRKHMEYLRERGSFVDVPYQEILEAWRESYPSLDDWGKATGTADFEREAGADASSSKNAD